VPPATPWTALASRASVSVATSVVTTYDSGVSFVQDNFVGVQGTLLHNHVGEGGATWTQRVSLATSNVVLAPSGRARDDGSSPNGSFYYASGQPLSADYRVIADITKLSAAPTAVLDVLARVSTTTDDRYGARYATNGTPGWSLYKVVKGVGAALGAAFNDTIPNGTTRQVELRVRGSDIQLFVDGVSRVSVTDSSITLAGVVGLGGANLSAAGTDATGLAIDNFNASTLTSVSTSTVVTQSASPTPPWTARSGATGTWGVRSAASTAWSALT
jgi:hypothetical protein